MLAHHLRWVQVFRGLRNGVQPVAVKHLRNSSGGNDVTLRALRREIRTLRLVSADANVVQFYGAVLDGAVPAMVLEYCEVRRPPRHPAVTGRAARGPGQAVPVWPPHRVVFPSLPTAHRMKPNLICRKTDVWTGAATPVAQMLCI